MDFAAWRVAVECDWRVLDVAPKELCSEQQAWTSGVWARVGVCGLGHAASSRVVFRVYKFTVLGI